MEPDTGSLKNFHNMIPLFMYGNWILAKGMISFDLKPKVQGRPYSVLAWAIANSDA